MDPNREYDGKPVGLILVGSIAKTSTYRYQRRNPDTGEYEKGSGTLKQSYPATNNPNTGLQIINRQRLRHAMAAWAALTENQKETYRDRADEIRRNHPNPLDRDGWLLGHNLFVREYEEVDRLLEPQYDSGWTAINQGQSIVKTHNLAGDVDKYLVVMDAKDGDCDHAIQGIGGEGDVGVFDHGFYWCHLTTTQITMNRGASDPHAPQVRIRIWIYE